MFIIYLIIIEIELIKSKVEIKIFHGLPWWRSG